MNQTNPGADFYFDKPGKWQDEIRLLRKIVLDCGLTEELKWGVPCYQSEQHNTVLIHVFKDYCALLFFKGALMQDPGNLLVQQTKNTQATRQLRFTALKDISSSAKTIKAYVYEAIEIEKAGLKVVLKKTEAFEMADEFREKLDKSAKLKKAFEALTPGRQRAYLLQFAAPKQAKTRLSRVEKAIPQILDGKGPDD